jgi:hypothetical protein
MRLPPTCRLQNEEKSVILRWAHSYMAALCIEVHTCSHVASDESANFVNRTSHPIAHGLRPGFADAYLGACRGGAARARGSGVRCLPHGQEPTAAAGPRPKRARVWTAVHVIETHTFIESAIDTSLDTCKGTILSLLFP